MSALICSLDQRSLTEYVIRQTGFFFPDADPLTPAILRPAVSHALKRLAQIQPHLRGKHHRQHDRPFFNHLNSDHYAMFLYLLAYQLGRQTARRAAAAKIFLLNKALHALDVYFEVELPRIFLFAHPVGTVLGRATYGDFLVVMQNCTVGNVDGRYPRIGRGVVLSSGVSVLGNCKIGTDVCVGAGSLVINTRIPPAHNAVGRAGELRVFPATAPKWRDYFSP